MVNILYSSESKLSDLSNFVAATPFIITIPYCEFIQFVLKAPEPIVK